MVAMVLPLCHTAPITAHTRKVVREPTAAYETKVDPNGRIVLPAPVRRQLGVGPGDDVVLRLEHGGVRVTSRATAIREAQALVRRHVKPGVSLVKGLLDWRREESARD
jgi:AbrB family looped-hinge helix DNA binding protein